MCLHLEGWDEQEGNKLIGNIEHVLSETEKSKIENEIQKEEIFNAVQSFKLNKSPGEDGIIAELYQTYWYLINEDLLELFNHEFWNIHNLHIQMDYMENAKHN